MNARGVVFAGLAFLLCARASAADAPQRGDPAARLSDAGAGSEFWDVNAMLDSGYRVVARFIITNEGPGSHTGVGMGYLIFPDGHVREFKYGKQRDNWSISDDRLRIKVASAVLDFRGDPQLFEMDSDKSGIKIYLYFPRDRATLHPPASVEGERFTDLVRSPAPTTGTLWVQGMEEPLAVRGTVTVTHTWMERSESDLAVREIEVSARPDDDALYLSDLTTPEGERRRWMVVRRGGDIVFRSDDFALAIEESSNTADDRGYPLPTRMRISGDGVSGEIRAEHELLRRDPLEIIPQPFRFLLSFKAQPRRIWAAAKFALRVRTGSGEPLDLQGDALTVVTYVNPLR